jgi:3-isopropylmalate dehydratase small subunit
MVKLDKSHWYKHVPKSAETSHEGKVTVLWNQQVKTDGIIPNNELDVIIRDDEKATCVLIDNAISRGRNVIKKEAEKVLKYKDLTKETQHM